MYNSIFIFEVCLIFIAAIGVVYQIISPLITHEALRKFSLLRLVKQCHLGFPIIILVLAFLFLGRTFSRLGNSMGTIKFDFTPYIAQMEGNLIESIQKAIVHPSLTFVFNEVYSELWTLWFFLTFGIYALGGKIRIAWAIFLASVLGLLLIHPFFYLFPVYEAWITNADYSSFYQLTGIIKPFHPSPVDEALIREVTGYKYCFPSYHTTAIVAITFILFAFRRKKMAIISTMAAIGVIISTIYLGIHWVIDIWSGILFGIFIGWLVLHFEIEIDFPFKIRRFKWSKEILVDRQ